MSTSEIPTRGPISLSPPSLLPLPRSLRHNRSFAKLARWAGIAAAADKADSDSGSDIVGEEDDDDDDPHAADDDADCSSDVDEESLMWDAQTALIAHQPALASKYYAAAALPPHCSSAACLALGNLLARGSGLYQTDESPNASRKPSLDVGPSEQPTSPPVSWFASIFGASSSPVVEKPPLPRLTSSGWGLPTDGKRAHRDVEGMGKAGGWLILGIGWIIDSELRAARTNKTHLPSPPSSHDDGDYLVFDSKGKGRAQTTPAPPPAQLTSASSSGADSFFLHTPDEEGTDMDLRKRIKLLYDLVTPLLHLYRHGHIQKHDPVALPPIAPSQLPTVLRPQGDSEKRRNVWYLGSAVASKLLELGLLWSNTQHLGNDTNMRRQGVLIIAYYIRGLTSSPDIAEASFKAIIKQGPSGLETPDDLIRQAYRRLTVILKTTGGTPLSPDELDRYPFPLIAKAESKPSHSRKASYAASVISFAESTAGSARLMTPVKSSASLASLSCDTPVAERMTVAAPAGANACNTLRNVQRQQRMLHQARTAHSSTGPRWPQLAGWSLATPRQTLSTIHSPDLRPNEDPGVDTKDHSRPQLRSFASSPQLGAAQMPPPPAPRRLPFEPTQQVAAIDPELAALELKSALTKHVTCSVCGADGVNFPNCRKCGLTFCSRKCRVDETGAGNGKRHICGAWESRRLLQVPGSPLSPKNLTPVRPRGVLYDPANTPSVPKVH